MKSARLTLAAGLLVLGSAGVATAQNPYYQPGFVPPRQRPVVSPYLNLLGGGSPALNYFNGVVPQRQFGNAINQNQAQLRLLQTQIALAMQGQSGSQQAAAGVLTTGHPVSFQSFQQYFGNLGSPAAAAHAPAAASQQALPFSSSLGLGLSGRGFGLGRSGQGIGLGVGAGRY